MTLPTDCTRNRDSLKLVREGTSQDQRHSQTLDPAYAPVNERKPEHGMVFAKAYSAFLQYYDLNTIAVDDWTRFFSDDVSVQLALAAIQDVEYYQQKVQAHFKVLNDHTHDVADAVVETKLREHLGALFSIAATLAWRLDDLKQNLPPEIRLKGALQNLIQSQLAPAFKLLLLYYRDGLTPDPPLPPDEPYFNDVESPFNIMGAKSSFKTVRSQGLSKDWMQGLSKEWEAEENLNNWADYLNHLDDPVLYAPTNIYGSGTTLFSRINHIAGHTLFTSLFDQFLKVFARVVSDAKVALEDTFTKWDGHEPHYALFLAFLRVFEEARTEINTLTGRHLDFYYREVLRLKEKPAEPGHVHLLVELAKHANSHEFKTGELFSAGKDNLGIEVFFANNRDVVANQARVTSLKTLYRHDDESGLSNERIYASPVANSDDGLGAELTSVDQSWHPFLNITYQQGVPAEIKMPKAQIGFAVTSHYLYLTEGYRRVKLNFELQQAVTFNAKVTVYLTTEKGWHALQVPFQVNHSNSAIVLFEMEADAPAIHPYNAKIHGGDFQTTHPVVKVVLQQDDNPLLNYAGLEKIIVNRFTLAVSTGLDDKLDLLNSGLTSLAVSTDFGEVDLSKPFQPFGPAPQTNAALVIGSKEALQKAHAKIRLKINWKGTPEVTPEGPPTLLAYYLSKKEWTEFSGTFAFNASLIALDMPASVSAAIDYTPNRFYATDVVAGFLKLSLDGDFGHKDWPIALATHFAKIAAKDPRPLPATPYTPEIESLSLCYYALSDAVPLDSKDGRDTDGAKFYHLYPFGSAEQHPQLKNETQAASASIYLFPQFKHLAGEPSEAEFYLGITGLKPPQSLAVLFQVADGTANPLSEKPPAHIAWSYLHNNEWIAFAQNEVEDQTGGLLNSGMITFAVPRNASSANTLLPAGMHWLRASVATASDAVCRLVRVSAQALQATYKDQGNDPAFTAKPLAAGSISKLDQPDAEVKKITQPFASYGGRGAEAEPAFYTRISERLRHKDRAIALWDYERLVLEAFPQIYKVKCLNHTHYQAKEANKEGIYKELAPGHVTVVTIPNRQFHTMQDPLRPFTSLGVLKEIDAFLKKRLSCFVTLHVKNPEFEEVHVDFSVRLVEGADETFYIVKLQDAMTRFLSPWAFSNSTRLTFGGKIVKSVLINFVEEQPYVDYVTDFRLFHHVDGAIREQATEIEGSKAVSILVSVPATEHKITPIQSAEAQASRENCRCEP